MDSGFKTALVTAILLAFAAPAAAQEQDGGAGTDIFGNKELPKGLTIVPWKKNRPGELTENPTRLVDEPLEPIDPDVFRRRLQYYEQAERR